MARPNPIRSIMESELPSLTYQRKLGFRPSVRETRDAYRTLNRYLFDNRLKMPEIQQGTIRQCWGYCQWQDDRQDSGSYCTIKLMDKWFAPQWWLNTLAHEMVHQWQWDIIGMKERGGDYEKRGGAHGPDFFQFREVFDYYGLHLKTSHGMKRWFRHQDFTRC